MGAKIHNYGSGDWAFECPACKFSHSFRVNGDTSRPQWEWNGSLESPTFKPSLKVNGDTPYMCHLSVTDGRIKFHEDSRHSMAGKTVDMADWGL